MATPYSDNQWRAWHKELTDGLASGKYRSQTQFCKEKGVAANTMWYVCRRLGLETKFSKKGTSYSTMRRHARQGKTDGKFVQFAPISMQKLEVIIDDRIKIMIPREDMSSIKSIVESLRGE